MRIGSVDAAAHPSRPRRPYNAADDIPHGVIDRLMTALDDALEAHLDATHETRIASYKDFLRIPSISGIPAHADDCRRAATWLAEALRTAGVEHVEVAETGGHPVVYGDWLHAEGAPTILVYGHYDVQPVDPLDLWTSPPFEPVVVDGRMLARGAADDKGQIHLHVMAAAAILATRGAFPVNVRYIFEGEEESRSVHLDRWMEANRERLTADVAIISDSGFFEGNIPSITVGLRGIMYAQVDVVGGPVDLHSGSFGGAVENPANALATIIAALKGPDGRILVPGFYDDVVALTDADRAALAALPFDEAAYQAIHRRAGPRRRGRVHRAGAQGRTADARRERHLGRVHRRRHEDHHPGPRARQDQLPARRRPGSRRGPSRSSARMSMRSRPPASRRRSRTSAAAARA